MKLTRQIVVEEVYELPGVTHPKTAREMLKKSEEWGKPYEPVRTRVVRRGRWKFEIPR